MMEVEQMSLVAELRPGALDEETRVLLTFVRTNEPKLQRLRGCGQIMVETEKETL